MKRLIFCVLMLLFVLTGCRSQYTETDASKFLPVNEIQEENIQKPQTDLKEQSAQDAASASKNDSVKAEGDASTVESKIEQDSKLSEAEQSEPINLPKPTKDLSENSEIYSDKNIADEGDAEWIEKQVISLINGYRKSKLVYLSGLSQYDRCRSRQLVNNFAHDTDDEREAATSIKYGEYIVIEESRYDFETEKIVYTGETTEYYQVDAREAIGKGGIACRAPDEIAEEIAEGFRNSKGHWSYLGSDEYSFVGCGVTIKDGMWYACISVAAENTDK